jgi:hypothetical protein
MTSSGCDSTAASSQSQLPQATQSFVSYNPNSKSIVGGSGAAGLDLNNIIITTTNNASGVLSSLTGGGVTAIVQPLNEQQLRKSMHLAQNVSLNFSLREAFIAKFLVISDFGWTTDLSNQIPKPIS